MICTSCFVFVVCGTKLILPRKGHRHSYLILLSNRCEVMCARWTFLCHAYKSFHLTSTRNRFIRFGCCVLAFLVFSIFATPHPDSFFFLSASCIIVCIVFFLFVRHAFRFVYLFIRSHSLVDFDKNKRLPKGRCVYVSVIVHTWESVSVCSFRMISTIIKTHSESWFWPYVTFQTDKTMLYFLFAPFNVWWCYETRLTM